MNKSTTVGPGIWLLSWIQGYDVILVTQTTYSPVELMRFGQNDWIEVDCRGHFEGNSMRDVKFIPDFKTQYNLSDEEINAIVKELKDIYEPNKQLTLPEVSPQKDTKIPDFKPVCTFHEWVWYTGLKETFEHCKKCGEKKR